MFWLFVLVANILTTLGVVGAAEDTGAIITVSSSCNGISPDGMYYIKPTASGDVIPVICSHGFTMLDLSLNFDAVSQYFTSIYQYGDANLAVYGTDCGEHSGWRDWFSPADEDTLFRVAKECLACETSQMYGDNTAYYQTTGYICPTNNDNGGCDLSIKMGEDTLNDKMCNVCDDSEDLERLCGEMNDDAGKANSESAWCDCYALQLSADTETEQVHAMYCQNSDLSWRPSVVADRSQCTCYRPSSEIEVTYTVPVASLPVVTMTPELRAAMAYIDPNVLFAEEDTSPTDTSCDEHLVELTQADFADGTYRITDCGHYVLTEDIVVDFNGPTEAFSYADGDSPNSYAREDLHWFPTSAQQESGEYPGVDSFWGTFSLGFFAAVTIETSDVRLDLGGHSLSMSRVFYLQQRFFALIELGNKQFEARQGPVDFGRDDISEISNIVIENGILGLSSHHGIHGGAEYLTIRRLIIRNFDVGGIQCNGCQHAVMSNLEIGPQNADIPVLGRYVHARVMLSRLRYLVDEHGEDTLIFSNRGGVSQTVRALADRLIEQLDMIYFHVVDGIEFKDDNTEWAAAKHTFLNPTGWLDGGSAYGILLNGEGTAVVNIGRRVIGTDDIIISDVHIHDLSVSPLESFWTETSDALAGTSEIAHGFFFETLDWLRGGIYDERNGKYVGDAYTDLLFASNELLREDFCALGALFNLDGLRDWVFPTRAAEHGTEELDVFHMGLGRNVDFKCGSDVQSHAAKGAIAIRIDGTQQYVISDVQIDNVRNWGGLGSDACGEYDEIEFAIGFGVDKDLQYGYTGDNVHGILTDYAEGHLENIRITNLESRYGSAIAIALYKGTQTSLSGFIAIDGIVAGSAMSTPDAHSLILPNAQPFVCSVLVGPNSDVSDEFNPQIIQNEDYVAATATNMYGHDWCGARDRVGVMDTVGSPEGIVGVIAVRGAGAENDRVSAAQFGDALTTAYALYPGMWLIMAVSLLALVMFVAKFTCCDCDGPREKHCDQSDSYTDMMNTYGSIDE